MIKIENMQTFGWAPALRGMRNPLNSWALADTVQNDDGSVTIGERDKRLAIALAKSGTSHSKYRRMITVYMDVTAPLYWWKEADTYKVGTVADSCSTMHTIMAKEFEESDFSFEKMDENTSRLKGPLISYLNAARLCWTTVKDPEERKRYWYSVIQLLPSSFNQKRTLMLNYEVLANIYATRKDHKLDEWREFCKVIELLPCSELFMVNGGDDNG